MCVSCGCGEGFADHGNSDNITADKKLEELSEEDIARAAEAQGIPVSEVLSNLKHAQRS
jgi:hypothetical protein